MGVQLLAVRIQQIVNEADEIRTYALVHPDGGDLPPFTAGAHIDVRTPGGLVRQYSLCNDPRERDRYLIGVLNDPASKGGSRSLHEKARVGDTLSISAPRNHFELVEQARRHLLLAGGIGVTPMMAMIERLTDIGADFTMHYCTRTPSSTAFRDRLAALAGRGRVVLHHDGGDPAKGLNIAAALARHEPGTHLYYCGPTGFMLAVREGAALWPPDTVHFEYFAPAPSGTRDAPGSNDRFQIRLGHTGATFEVPANRTIVEVLRQNGVDVDTSCEAGTCGTCKTRYLEGTPMHKDFVLTDREQREFVMICCARSLTPILVLDL